MVSLMLEPLCCMAWLHFALAVLHSYGVLLCVLNRDTGLRALW